MNRYTIDGDGDKVVLRGATLDCSSGVFTSDSVTAYELAKEYSKTVTALVDGRFVGWGFVMDFIRYKSRQEEAVDISDITYWHESPSGEYCRYHCMLLVAFGGREAKDFTTGRLSEEENELYFSQVRGRNLPKSKKKSVTFRTLYDNKGEIITPKIIKNGNI